MGRGKGCIRVEDGGDSGAGLGTHAGGRGRFHAPFIRTLRLCRDMGGGEIGAERGRGPGVGI